MMRFLPYGLVVLAWLGMLALALTGTPENWWIVAGLLTPLVLIGVRDILQRAHSLQRNYPLVGHFRAAFESIRPQIRQYLMESSTDGRPFDRGQRSLVYQRAKNVLDTVPFGTERDVREVAYEWVNHSMSPQPAEREPFRITIGNAQCAQPYAASVFNISAMSFGSLSAAAIRALNIGAKRGGFAHDTGEGGLSPYHLENGGDLIWEVGTGYFSTRMPDGAFDPDRFRTLAAHAQVKMIEIKLSQGAKPGHGGILPAAKLTQEIAGIRGVPLGRDCVSPAGHAAFSTPTGLLEFVAQLRKLSGGKPTGFKLCVGHRWEFLGICKAMLETGIFPDFIVVDGKEGGTGAAPVEFSDHVGTPLREGLLFVHNALVGCNVREHIRIGASGKIISAFDIAAAMAMGADWCNSARGFMFALGCLQSQKCHTNKCPVGIATQDPSRQRGLVVGEKAERVANFHGNTVEALAELVAAAGLKHPSEIGPRHILRRVSPDRVVALDHAYAMLEPGQLLDGGTLPEQWADDWRRASATSFAGD